MEIKLMVVTHKEGFGSIPYFSENLNEYYRTILEKVNYIDYPSDEKNMVEINKEEHYVYFLTYIGGNDEFGRTYSNIISTLFEFSLTEQEKERLKNILYEVKEDITEDIDVFLTKSYFTTIKRRVQQNKSIKLTRKDKEEIEEKQKQKEIKMLEEEEKKIQETAVAEEIDEKEKEIVEREKRIQELQEKYRRERIERKRMIKIKQKRHEREKEVELIIRRTGILNKELTEVQGDLERISVTSNLAVSHVIKIFERMKLETDNPKKNMMKNTDILRVKNPEKKTFRNIYDGNYKSKNKRMLYLFLVFIFLAFLVLVYLNIAELKKIF